MKNTDLGFAAKSAIAIGLALGAATTSIAQDYWGNQCRTLFFSCRSGSCNSTGSYACCMQPDGGSCLCVDVNQPCP